VVGKFVHCVFVLNWECHRDRRPAGRAELDARLFQGRTAFSAVCRHGKSFPPHSLSKLAHISILLPAEFIFVVRHGETKANENGIEAGPLDFPLAKKGRKEVEFIAKTLSDAKIKEVYSSPVFRAVQTAKILARPHSLKVKTLNQLTEAKIKHEFVGKKGRHHILTDPEDYSETNSDLLARAWQAFRIVSKSSGNAIMVSHGDVITALLEDIVERKTATEKYYVLHPDPASLSIIRLGDRPALVLYNYHRKMFAGY
jgi:broad specificity phosphatase PhoE